MPGNDSRVYKARGTPGAGLDDTGASALRLVSGSSSSGGTAFTTMMIEFRVFQKEFSISCGLGLMFLMDGNHSGETRIMNHSFTYR